MTGFITRRMTIRKKIKVVYNNFLFYYYIIIRCNLWLTFCGRFDTTGAHVNRPWFDLVLKSLTIDLALE